MDLSALGAVSQGSFASSSLNKKEKIESESFENTFNKAVSDGDDKELREACVEFESYFLKMLMKSMRQTVNSSDSFLKKNNGEKMFEDMLDEEYCNSAAKGNGVGLAKELYKQLSRKNLG